MKQADKDKPGMSYVKYSGLAFQMFFVLLAGWLIGNYFDRLFELEKPYIGVGLAFLLLIGIFNSVNYAHTSAA